MFYVTVILAFCLVAGSHSEVDWVDEQIDSVKEKAHEIQKLSSNILFSLDRLNQHNSLMKEQRSPKQVSTVAPSRTYPRSCIEYYNMGDMRTGWKTIDPYKNQKHFSVRCDYDGSDIVTEIGMNADWSEIYSGPLICYDQPDLRVPGYNDICAGARNSIPYQLTDSDIMAAISVSGRCSQAVTWSCHSNSLLYLQEYSGNTTLYGRALEQETRTLQQGVCDCGIGMQRTCHMCHCGLDKKNGWMTDDILVTGSSRLPIKTVMLGDLANKRELAQITVQPIKCTAPMFF